MVRMNINLHEFLLANESDYPNYIGFTYAPNYVGRYTMNSNLTLLGENQKLFKLINSFGI